MIESLTTIINKFGLHTRAAAKLVALAARFESQIEIRLNDRIANAKSIMAVITLGASCGTELSLCVNGSDEVEAHTALLGLIHNRFGEAE